MKTATWLKASLGGITLLFFAVVLWIAYSGRGGTMFAFLKHVPGGDKTGHVLLMGFLAFTLSWLTSFRVIRMGIIQVQLGAIAVFIFITIEEFAQLFSANRTFDLLDLSCNYLGIGLAVMCSFLVTRFYDRAAE
ncbi:VanZ family protein [Pontiellaceae bacterium B1224]|nr:VanZ family protein [Pontiellaceae bacterium B1224]